MADYLTERKSELYLTHLKCGTYRCGGYRIKREATGKFMEHAMECRPRNAREWRG